MEGDKDTYNSEPWQTAYLIMGLFQILGLLDYFISPEPNHKVKN
jgi:hypothetical protein